MLLRLLEEYDGAEPAATSVAVMNLLALARLTGEATYQARAEAVLAAWGPRLASQPRVAPFMLAALATSLLPAAELAIVAGDDVSAAQPLRDAMDRRYLPAAVVVPVLPAHAAALTAAVPWVGPLLDRYGAPAAYLCRDFVCEQPTSDPATLGASLDALAPPDVAVRRGGVMSGPLVRVIDEAGGTWRRLRLDAPPGHILSLAMVQALVDCARRRRTADRAEVADRRGQPRPVLLWRQHSGALAGADGGGAAGDARPDAAGARLSRRPLRRWSTVGVSAAASSWRCAAIRSSRPATPRSACPRSSWRRFRQWRRRCCRCASVRPGPAVR